MREELYPRRAAHRAQGGRRLALRARDRRARPAQDEPRRAARRAARASRVPGGICLTDGFPVPRLGFEQRARRRRRRHERRDRRRLDHRQGHARPLHAARGGALSGLGLRHPRRLLDARAPRGDRGARRLAAAPAVASRHGLPAARAADSTSVAARDSGAQNAPSRCIEADEPPAGVEDDADGVEAQLAATRAVVRLGSSRRPCAGPGPACVGRARPTASRGRARVLTSTNTSDVVAEADEVELAEARAVVAGDDRVAEALHVRGGGVLADAAEVMAEVGGHAPSCATRVHGQHPCARRSARES